VAEPQTVNVGIIVPNTGDLVGTWGSAAVNPDFVAIDGYLGGVQTISLSNVPVTLTSPAAFTPTPSGGPTQAQNAVLKLTGTLTSNVQITLPLPGYYIIDNSITVSSFVATLKAAGAGEIISIPYGSVQQIYNDGTNVRFCNLQPVGSYFDYGGPGIPGWIPACTKPPFLFCDGSTFNAVTYPVLNAILGGNVLPDFRGRSNYFLNSGTGRLTTAGAGIDGNTLFAAGGGNGVGLAANQVPSLSSSGIIAVQPNGTGGLTLPATAGAGWGLQPTPAPGGNQVPFTVGGAGIVQVTSFTGTATVTYTNGAQVPIGSTTPGAVGGIRMIRAG